MSDPVGVLGLQGAYQKHIEALCTLGESTRLVRLPRDLDDCSGLIIPGGESTTMSLLMQKDGLHDAIKTFADNRSVMGVCAGMILMASEVDDKRVTPLGLIPFKTLRNHYGRQVHSFSTELQFAFDRTGPGFHAQFIRAPGVVKVDNNVNVLAQYHDEPVMLQYDRHLALSFHPELSCDNRVHAYWLQQCVKGIDARAKAQNTRR